MDLFMKFVPDRPPFNRTLEPLTFHMATIWGQVIARMSSSASVRGGSSTDRVTCTCSSPKLRSKAMLTSMLSSGTPSLGSCSVKCADVSYPRYNKRRRMRLWMTARLGVLDTCKPLDSALGPSEATVGRKPLHARLGGLCCALNHVRMSFHQTLRIQILTIY